MLRRRSHGTAVPDGRLGPWIRLCNGAGILKVDENMSTVIKTLTIAEEVAPQVSQAPVCPGTGDGARTGPVLVATDGRDTALQTGQSESAETGGGREAQAQAQAPQAQAQTQTQALRTRIVLATSFEEFMQVVAVRAAVYMSEQACPFAEEFDGNDFAGGHLLALVDGEPAACLRARYFSDFVKLERLAVRREFRQSRLAFQIVRAGLDLARQKGYRLVYGHARRELVRFWRFFGAQPKPGGTSLRFSGQDYEEMVIRLEPAEDAIGLACDGYTLIRPEGQWDRPGVLENGVSDRQRQTPEEVAP